MAPTTYDFVPRDTQLPYFYPINPLWISIIVAHRRAGKSEGAVVCDMVPLLNWLLSQKEILTVANTDVRLEYPKLGFYAKHKNQARNIIWPYFDKYLSLFPHVELDRHRLVVSIPRPHLNDYIEIQLKAAKDYESSRGEKYLRLYLDEYQEYSPAAWSPLYSTLTDLNGIVRISGTAKFMDNILYQLMKEIHDGHRNGKFWVFPHNHTQLLRDKIDVIKKNMTKEEFLREYECNFTTSASETYYGDLIHKFTQHPEYARNHTYCPERPIVLGLDLGVGKTFAAFAGQVLSPTKLLLLDYYEDYELMGDFASDFRSDWGKAPDHIFMPHDGERRQLALNKTVKNRDIIKLAFPESQVHRSVKKTPSLQKDIQLIKENFHVIHYLDQLSRPSDLFQGITKVAQYGPKTNDFGIITSQVDKSAGYDHAADALRTLLRGLKIKNGRIGKANLGLTQRESLQVTHSMPSFSRGGPSRREKLLTRRPLHASIY